MPTQITTRGPVQVREYVPDRASQPTYNERGELVQRVRVHEKGADVIIDLYRLNLRIGTITVPREAELETLRRLFGEQPERRADRAAFQVVLQGFEDAVLAGDPERVIAAWRRAFEVFDTLSRDLQALAGLSGDAKGAA